MAKILGAHLSISKGIYKIQKEMDKIGAKCCAMFLKNQKRYEASPYKSEDILKFHKETVNPKLIVPHGSFLINLGNAEKIEQSYKCFIDDLKRCASLGIGLYNIHPGSDVNKMGSKCLDLIAEYLNKAIEEVPGVIILLENMAGQGNVVCSKFEEISTIISKIKDKTRIGVCLDTCHMFGAGYDIRTKEKFENVMKDFDKVIGLKYLKAVHLNDSKMPLGSKKDRHECIGQGFIGIEAFEFIMNNEIFDDIPMVLETPEIEKYEQEIQLLNSLIKN
ncbi:endonuclease 4 [Nosema bombycis CQ1]|uniref:Apurinic-apyrimidinic endonuclease 1 n=1 Tax=Nosema bombycis (strain CQ1 / CVCC 102059) TaxID=578461 RepID=R0KNV6_NOSB1|nr:endonuclease 4 [Nosema bombycis CQ1]|eukprot:EOB11857.1 endonuclease 4 [Nosema bombycis CQ1]